MLKKVVTLPIILILLFTLKIQADELPESNLSNPRNTIENHLIFLQTDNYHPEKSALSLNLKNPESEEAKELAIKLLKIYDGNRLWVTIDDIPDDPDYIDSISGKHTYTPFAQMPEIYVVKKGEKWFYSEHTINSIERLYEQTFPFVIPEILNEIPVLGERKFLGVMAGQYIAILVLLILAVILYYVLKILFNYVLIKFFKYYLKKITIAEYIRQLSKPISFFIIVALLDTALPSLGLPIKVVYYLTLLVKIIQPLWITIILYRLSNLLGDFIETVSKKVTSSFLENIVPLLRKLFKVVIVVLGAIYILDNINIPITPLIAGASIGGLAFALAAQDTVKNLFGSITIFSDQPFEIGDWINSGGVEGVVEEVGVRTTRIRTFYNSLISIPNGKLADSVIDNMGKREYRRYSTKIAITYDTPPDLIEAFVIGLRRIIEEHSKTRKGDGAYQIYLNDLGSTSIEILFYIFFKVPDWGAELKARHEVLAEVIRMAEYLGVRFAFPTQTIHIEEFPERKSLTPVYSENNEEFMQKVKSFIEGRKLALPDNNEGADRL